MATYVTVVCPQCSNRMKASSDYIGKRGRCPSCKALVEITATEDGGSIATTFPATQAALSVAVKARAASTDPPVWLSGLIGVAATLVLYVLFFAVRSTYVGELFVERGIIPYITVVVTCWGVAMLVLKFLAVKRQQSYAELELDLIPLEIGVQITPSNVDQFLANLGKLPAATRSSILGRRIQQALEHFKSRQNVPEVQSYLATQAEIDASAVDSGYTLLRAFIWAIPILGFIGTVLGISDAVSGLSGTLAQGKSVMDGLGVVTAGLAVAFDTTLVALAMAILLLFPTESLKKIEYAMLDRIEAFANESLLRRLADEGGAADMEDMPEVVKFALESAFQEHQRWLAQWQAQVAELGKVVGGDFEQAVGRIQASLAQGDGEQIRKLHDAAQMLSDVFHKMTDVTVSLHQTEQQLAARFERLFGNVQQLGTTLSGIMEAGRDLLQRQQEALRAMEKTELNQTMTGLSTEIQRLSERIAGPAAWDDARTATAVLDPSEASSKDGRTGKGGGLFGIFRRS